MARSQRTGRYISRGAAAGRRGLVRRGYAPRGRVGRAVGVRISPRGGGRRGR